MIFRCRALVLQSSTTDSSTFAVSGGGGGRAGGLLCLMSQLRLNETRLPGENQTVHVDSQVDVVDHCFALAW